MAISIDTDSYGLLDYWRKYTTLDIFNFNQAAGTGAPLTDQHEVTTQSERELIARSLNTAFQQIEQELCFPIRPRYITDERHRVNPRFPLETQLFRLRHGFVEDVGTRATTLIKQDAVVSYSDEGNLTVDDTATITVTTTVDADEIQVFYRTVDGAPSAAHERWRIEPLTVTKSGNTATITGHRALFVKYDGIMNAPYNDPDFTREDKNSANTAADDDFLGAVDVYRVYTDTTNAAVGLTDPYYTGDTTSTTLTETTCGVLVMDSKHGHVFVRPTSTPTVPIHYVKFNYLAGYPLSSDGHPDNALLEAVIRLANANMPRSILSADDGKYNVWQTDRKPADIQPENLNNPYGVLRGHEAAWRITQQYRLGQNGG